MKANCLLKKGLLWISSGAKGWYKATLLSVNPSSGMNTSASLSAVVGRITISLKMGFAALEVGWFDEKAVIYLFFSSCLMVSSTVVYMRLPMMIACTS